MTSSPWCRPGCRNCRHSRASRRRLLGALAEPLDQFAAIGLHGAVELAEVAGDQVAERRGIRGAIFSASSAPPCENISSNACRRAASMSRTASPRSPTLVASCSALVAEGIVDAVAAAEHDGVGDAVAGLLELATTSPPRRLRSSTSEFAGRLERVVDLVAALRDGLGKAARRVEIAVGDLLRSAPSSVRPCCRATGRSRW